ncbi:MAG TPA: 4-alpha-glucanotransferase [Bacilli bacterium]|nr:4-alpha-glucanotransferase [Bacilli bacterium]
MRKAGILLAVSSLPSRHGIGDFGPEAYSFVKSMKRMGFKLWQVLPLNPLGYGNSPYQPYSSKAMDELYISLDMLVKDGLLTKAPRFHAGATRVDYDSVRDYKGKLLHRAFEKFVEGRSYRSFVKQNEWLYPYAVFITLKKHNDLKQWHYWPKPHRDWIKTKADILCEYEADIKYEMFLQYVLYRQWTALKKYANKLGVELVGDIPIYVGIDSLDVWDNQNQFLLDNDAHPTHIAGVPPDYFSVTGQRWGNPLYDWDKMQKDGFKFWLDRLSYNAKLFDYIRIDHFRAFDTYWKIPSSCPTAVEGAWIEAPGYAFFDKLFANFPTLKILAEDLGDLRPQVLQLRDHYRFPGMKIVQFSFDFDKPIIFTQYHETNMAVYPGTHDNQTSKGWYRSLTKEQRLQVRNVLAYYGYYYQNVADSIIALTLDSSPDVAIIPMQDILGLSDSARMNTPGTIGSPNWEWKMHDAKVFKSKRRFLKKLITKARR